MNSHPALRLLTATLRILSGLVIVATGVVTLAISGDLFAGAAAPLPGLAWALRLGGAALVAASGVILAVLLYAIGDFAVALSEIDESIRSSLAALSGDGETRP